MAVESRPTPRRTRLGIYDASPAVGAISRYVESILAEIDPAEFEVILFGVAEGPYKIFPRFKAINAPARASVAPQGTGGLEPTSHQTTSSAKRYWRRLAPRSLRLWAGFGRDCSRLAGVFRGESLDLLHTNYTGCEESPVAARMSGVPQVLGTFHVSPSLDLRRQRSGLGHRSLEVLSNHCLHRSIAVSESTRKEWGRRTFLSLRRIISIPNGVNAETFRRRSEAAEARRLIGIPDDGRVLIGGVGRLAEAKGFDFLLEAVALLAGEPTGPSLALAGEGPLRGSLVDRADKLGIADRVHFLGFHRDVRPVFEALDVFVLSSESEAMPYAVLEAMAMGLPVVGTSVGGVPEIIVEGVTGSLVPSRDPQALAGALRPLLASPELRSRMGAAGRTRVVEHFDEKMTVRRTIEVYRQLASRGCVRSGALSYSS